MARITHVGQSRNNNCNIGYCGLWRLETHGTPKKKRTLEGVQKVIEDYAGQLTTGSIDTGTTQTTGTISHMDNTTDTPLTPTARDGINNGFNIRVSPTPWLGKITLVDGQKFERFTAMWYGYRAGMKNLLFQKNRTQSGSFNDTIPILSPPSENNVGAYIQDVKNAGVDTTMDIADMDAATFKAMCKAMIYHEQKPGFVVNEADIDAAYDSIFNNN